MQKIRENKMHLRTVEMAYIAMAAIIIAVCSWISIPTVIPFTLQTFAVFCVLSILGGKCGTIAVALYLLIGLTGVPVFAGMKGGIGVLLGNTGGYVVGFIWMGLIYWLAVKCFGKKLRVEIIALLIGLFVLYAFGTAWFMLVYTKNTGAVGLGAALSWCVFPFIIPDLLKLGLALLIARRVRRFLPGGINGFSV